MPQLNPSPWLMIFMLIWTLFILGFFNKTLNFTHLNKPLTKVMKQTLNPWNWPWF